MATVALPDIGWLPLILAVTSLAVFLTVYAWNYAIAQSEHVPATVRRMFIPTLWTSSVYEVSKAMIWSTWFACFLLSRVSSFSGIKVLHIVYVSLWLFLAPLVVFQTYHGITPLSLRSKEVNIIIMMLLALSTIPLHMFFRYMETDRWGQTVEQSTIRLSVVMIWSLIVGVSIFLLVISGSVYGIDDTLDLCSLSDEKDQNPKLSCNTWFNAQIFTLPWTDASQWYLGQR